MAFQKQKNNIKLFIAPVTEPKE